MLPFGETRGKYRKPLASISIRAGSLNQSDRTLSFGSACLITHAGPEERCTQTALLETPPLSFFRIGSSRKSILPVSRRYLANWPGFSMSIVGSIGREIAVGYATLEPLLGELAQ